MVKKRVHILPKFLVFSSILIASILLFIIIIGENISHKSYSDYKKSSKENGPNPVNQVHLKKAVETSLPNPDAIFELGRSYIDNIRYSTSSEEKHKLYNMSKEAFLTALMHKSTDGRHWALYAWYIGHNKETNAAIECFERAIYLCKTDSYIHRLYAQWCVNQIKAEIRFGNMIRPIEMYRNKLEKDQEIQYYNNRFINGVSIARLIETALMEWDRALSLDETLRNQAAYNSLAELYLTTYELDKAIHHYELSDNKIMLSRCYMIKRDYDKTLDILGSIIKDGGTTLLENMMEIKQLLNDIIQEYTKNYQAFYWSGEIRIRSKQPVKAIPYFKTVIKLNPEHIETHLKLAKIYESTGETDLAIEEYETIISIDQNHKEAFYLLSETIRRNNKGSESMAE